MIEVKRYSYGFHDDGFGEGRHLGLIEKPDGALVRYDDYTRLEQECESLTGLYKMHKETESRETLELRENVDDLSMLVRQLVQALRKAAPDHALPGKALDYLKRKGLQGSPLRGATNDEAQATPSPQ